MQDAPRCVPQKQSLTLEFGSLVRPAPAGVEQWLLVMVQVSASRQFAGLVDATFVALFGSSHSMPDLPWVTTPGTESFATESRHADATMQ